MNLLFRLKKEFFGVFPEWPFAAVTQAGSHCFECLGAVPSGERESTPAVLERGRLSFRLRLATGAVAGGEAKVDLMDGVDRVDMVDGELGDRRVKFRVFKHREFETQS